MNKLASLNYDVSDYMTSEDGSLKVAGIADSLSKEARAYDLPDSAEIQDRPNKDFALVTYHSGQGAIKKFARFDKNITEINLRLLEATQDSLPDEVVKTAATNLVRAAKDFGLEYDGPLTKLAEEDSYIDPVVDLTQGVDEYAYQQKIAQVEEVQTWAMPSQAKYPIETEDQIKQACAYFEKHANEFDPVDALEFALNTQKAADSKGVEATPSISKYASVDTDRFNEDLPYHVDVRKSYLRGDQDEQYALYEDFTKVASDLSPSKAAKLLEAIDKEANLTRAWGKGLEHPLLATLGSQMDKTAEAGPTLEQLKELDDADLTPLVGNASIAELKGPEGVEVFHTLPMPIKRQVRKLIEG